MRILTVIGGIGSIGLAVALCIPVVLLVRQEVVCRRSARNTSLADLVAGSYSHHTNPSELLVSFGRLTFSGWRLWAAVAVLLVIAILFAWLGAYALLPRKSGS